MKRFTKKIVKVRAKWMDMNIYEALNNNEFEVFYQPQYDLITKKIIGAEALLRCKKGQQYISPDNFIPLAEKEGSILALEDFVIEEVCAACKKIININRFAKLAINISKNNLESGTLVEKIIFYVNKHKIPYEMLQIEITESAFIEDTIRVMKCLEDLKRLNIGVALDDFGTKYSSLCILKDLPIDTVKIDKCFVRDINHKKGRIILKHIAMMGKALDLDIISEGVEYQEQLLFLETIGCFKAQGYYFCKPIREEEFLNKYYLAI